MNLDIRDYLVAETVAWICALILAWIKERLRKELTANNLDSFDLLVAERSSGPCALIKEFTGWEKGEPFGKDFERELDVCLVLSWVGIFCVCKGLYFLDSQIEILVIDDSILHALHFYTLSLSG